MERQKFDQLAESVAERFRDKPDALAKHTFRWLGLGYLFVIGATILFVGGGLLIFLWGTQVKDVGIFLVILGAAMAIFGIGQVGTLVLSDQPEPKGRLITKEESPELHGLVESVCQTIGASSPDTILLSEEFNAYVAQIPRLGIFGWSKSWLVLGVPLLMAMSPREFSAILAHECAHLSKKHGRQGSLIARMHSSWDILFRNLGQKSGNLFYRCVSSIMGWFMNWYWPRFHVRARMLSRQNEFLADRLAVEATNRNDASSALWRTECFGRFMEHEFWNDLRLETETMPEPPNDFCERLAAAFAGANKSPKSQRWVNYSISQVSSSEDTHPSMNERLEAIGLDEMEKQALGFPDSPTENAAEALLGNWEQIENETNDRWRRSIYATWQDQHRRIKALARSEEKDQLKRSDSNFEHSKNPQELWEKLIAIVGAKGIEASESVLQQLISVDAQHVGARMAMGQLKLSQGDEQGVRILQDVIELQTPQWTHAAAGTLEDHYSRTGKRMQLRELRMHMDEFEKSRMEAEKERTTYGRKDVLLPHGLSPEVIQAAELKLREFRSCVAAWVVQKQVEYFPNERLYLVCVDTTRDANRAQHNDKLITWVILNLELPGRIFVVTPTGEFRAIAKQIMQRPQDKFYAG